jgi:acetoin utilization protein AcuB
MRLEEVMTKKVAQVDAHTETERARTEMRERNIHHLVVFEADQLAGIVSEDDLAGAPGGAPVRDRMSTRVVRAAPTTTVREAANLLRGNRVGCLPVLDGNRLVGIVTVSDLLELIGRGVERPVAESKRWTLRRRAPARKPGSPAR